MNNKYKLTDETKNVEGHILHQVQALTDIRNDVQAGTLGGWIESEENLSYEAGDSSWVYESGMVWGNSNVYNSRVHNSRVYNSRVDKSIVDNSRVDNSRVYNSRVDKSIVYNNSNVDNSNVYNSNVDNSNVDNSNVDNSNVYNSNVYNSNVDNHILTSIWNKYGGNLFPQKDSILIRIGCEVHSVEDWDEHGAEYARKNGESAWWESNGKYMLAYLKAEAERYPQGGII